MLAKERLSKITQRVNEQGSATAQELMEYLNASESTIRRDLNTLDAAGEIIKVHGGAMSINTSFKMRDDEIADRRITNIEEKKLIAQYAAGLIKKDDFVYIDAGTTTEFIIDYITEKNAVYVTNAVNHACSLSHMGCEVYLTGGRLKSATEAIVGAETLEALSKYNFTIGFWGTNGIHKKTGFTTPDREEAGVKRMSFMNCKKRYIVADASKFDSISPVGFADFDEAVIITEKQVKGYEDCKNIILAKK
ncbi:DeoR/GlpR transcriptional regulator [Lachnospiraceae bacterium MD329]|nr:DeoR/GlpR transcriptional regulator [Lachnospiraceae bacterium MD329]